jgi:hypothetical protein
VDKAVTCGRCFFLIFRRASHPTNPSFHQNKAPSFSVYYCPLITDFSLVLIRKSRVGQPERQNDAKTNPRRYGRQINRRRDIHRRWLPLHSGNHTQYSLRDSISVQRRRALVNSLSSGLLTICLQLGEPSNLHLPPRGAPLAAYGYLKLT